MALGGVLDRRSSLLGAAIGLIVGGAAGYVAASQKVEPGAPETTAHVAPPSSGAKSAAQPGAPLPMAQARPSFAQQGEDLVIQQMLYQMKIKDPTYLDVGAHEPIRNSNTYLFYAVGARGVLIEPNPALVEKLRAARPRDVVIESGIGVSEQNEADYYLFGGDGQLNTFSKEQADALVRIHRAKLEGVIKRKLIPINAVLEEHFKTRAPDVLSIDVEGLDYQILKSLDWTRWRPRIICVETSMVEDGRVNPDIVDLLEKLGYQIRGGSFVNTIFMDEKTWRAELAANADAGAAPAPRSSDAAP